MKTLRIYTVHGQAAVSRFLRPIFQKAALFLFCLLPVLAGDVKAAEAEQPVPTTEGTNWNQWNRPVNWGASADVIQLYLGGGYWAPADETNVLLLAGLGYFITDAMSLNGIAGLPIVNGLNNADLYTFTGGMDFHFLPKNSIGVYLGIGGGFLLAVVDEPALQDAGTIGAGANPVEGPAFRPVLSAHLGLEVYYAGILFSKLEGGYRLADYGSVNYYQNYSSPYVRLMTGVYF